jgi:hypothetical protein
MTTKSIRSFDWITPGDWEGRREHDRGDEGGRVGDEPVQESDDEAQPVI